MKSNIAVLLVLAVTSMVAFISVRDIFKPKTYLQRAEQLLDQYLLIDGHNDVAYMIRENFQNRFDKFDFNDLKQYVSKLNGTNGVTHTDMSRLKQGKLRGQFWASFAFCNSLAKDATRIHLEQVDTVKRLIRKHSANLEFVTDSTGLINAGKRNKKIASMIGLESGHAIDSSLSILRVFYDLGVRYMTLTHNCDVPWATNNLADLEPNNTRGLSGFGRKVIREMNRLGMIIDLSHTSYQTQLDALNETKAPLMFSHSSIYSLCNHTRNVRDDVLMKLKENNGIIMINFYNEFLTCGLKANISDVVDHINYVKDKIGADHVGIGSDFDGVPLTPDGLEDVSKYPDLFAALLQTGWSEEELGKLAGDNLIRVLRDVEKFSESVKDMEPIDDYITQQELGDEYKSCRTSF